MENLAQDLAAIKPVHRQEVEQVESAEDQQENQNRGPRHKGGHFAASCLVQNNGDGDEESRHAGAHQSAGGNLEERIVGPASDGDAAKQRHEDHPHRLVTEAR
ncbi:hypothetical protein LP421_10020 [Rhizobium sp. RCAM05350]|nr:hypothetical protein LP421_10020 [Rhizobium sp. RCAM05350]